MRCFKCGSQNDPVVGFINADESGFINAKDSNLKLFLCRQCIYAILNEKRINEE